MEQVEQKIEALVIGDAGEPPKLNIIPEEHREEYEQWNQTYAAWKFDQDQTDEEYRDCDQRYWIVSPDIVPGRLTPIAMAFEFEEAACFLFALKNKKDWSDNNNSAFKDAIERFEQFELVNMENLMLVKAKTEFWKKDGVYPFCLPLRGELGQLQMSRFLEIRETLWFAPPENEVPWITGLKYPPPDDPYLSLKMPRRGDNICHYTVTKFGDPKNIWVSCYNLKHAVQLCRFYNLWAPVFNLYKSPFEDPEFNLIKHDMPENFMVTVIWADPNRELDLPHWVRYAWTELVLLRSRMTGGYYTDSIGLYHMNDFDENFNKDKLVMYYE